MAVSPIYEKRMFAIRRATAADADAIASIFSPSLRLLTFLSELHSVAEERWFIENVILKECVVTVALAGEWIVSFIAVAGHEVRLLHTHPGFLNRGAGKLLIDHVKGRVGGHLELWCFQQNEGGRRFYEREGFRAVRFTDGEHNEEKLPDILYRWDPV